MGETLDKFNLRMGFLGVYGYSWDKEHVVTGDRNTVDIFLEEIKNTIVGLSVMGLNWNGKMVYHFPRSGTVAQNVQGTLHGTLKLASRRLRVVREMGEWSHRCYMSRGIYQTRWCNSIYYSYDRLGARNMRRRP